MFLKYHLLDKTDNVLGNLQPFNLFFSGGGGGQVVPPTGAASSPREP